MLLSIYRDSLFIDNQQSHLVGFSIHHPALIAVLLFIVVVGIMELCSLCLLVLVVILFDYCVWQLLCLYRRRRPCFGWLCWGHQVLLISRVYRLAKLILYARNLNRLIRKLRWRFRPQIQQSHPFWVWLQSISCQLHSVSKLSLYVCLHLWMQVDLAYSMFNIFTSAFCFSEQRDWLFPNCSNFSHF